MTPVKNQRNYGATNGKHLFTCGLFNGAVGTQIEQCQNARINHEL